jgi:hypothetical protein
VKGIIIFFECKTRKRKYIKLTLGADILLKQIISMIKIRRVAKGHMTFQTRLDIKDIPNSAAICCCSCERILLEDVIKHIFSESDKKGDRQDQFCVNGIIEVLNSIK